MLEDITVYKDLGIAGISIVIIYKFAKYTSDKAFREVERANDSLSSAQRELIMFVQNAYKENTQKISTLMLSFEDHIRSKETAIELLKEQQNMLKEQHELLRRQYK